MKKIIVVMLSTVLLSACHFEKPPISFTEAVRMHHNEFKYCRISNMQGLYWTRIGHTEEEACRQATLSCRQYQDKIHFTHHSSLCRRVMIR